MLNIKVKQKRKLQQFLWKTGVSSLVFFCAELGAVSPLSAALLAIGVNHDAISILFPITPLSFVLAFIRPSQRAFTLSQVLLVSTFIFGTIWPIHAAVAVHVPSVPLAVISAAIREVVSALSIHFVVIELTFKNNCASGRLVHSLAMLAAMQELSFILGTICPAFNTFSTFLILGPFTLVPM